MSFRDLNLLVIVLFVAGFGLAEAGVVSPGAELKLLSDTFEFTEGPAADAKGKVYFTDQPNDKIYIWSVDGKLSVFLEHCERSNGLYFDNNGELLACADLYNKLVSFNSKGQMSALVKKFDGKKLNGPNDLWRDSKGGIYFTDPLYKRPYWNRGDMEQPGQYIYYLKPDRKTVILVAKNVVQPNGIIGTPDGKTLYVADIGDRKTYSWKINDDGTLSERKLFCEMGSDGMTIDNQGNIYLTGKGVTVFNAKGEQIDHIEVPEGWTANVTFGGADFDTLFITASDSLYSIKTSTHGVTWKSIHKESPVAPGAKPEKVADGFGFTEGPAADTKGDVYFTDIPNNRIHKYSMKDGLSTWQENSEAANGLYFDPQGNMLVCQGSGRRIVLLDTEQKVTVLADNYKGKKLNQPNDLWRHPSGTIYFTDPYYGQEPDELELEVEGVYYLPAGGGDIVRVVDDMVRPNGVIGTKDGKTLYIADNSGGLIWRYKINADSSLSDKTFVAAVVCDGMTLDEKGNLYLTGNGVTILDPDGELIEIVDIPAGWSANVTFGGPGKKTLFVTAEDGLYTLKMNVKGI